MKALIVILFVSAINVSWQKEALSPAIDICRLFKDGVMLRKPGYCTQSIICENFKSKPLTTCYEPTQYYDFESYKCVSKRPSGYCAKQCKKTSKPFIVNKYNCNQWYKCSGATELGFGSCPVNMLFNEKLQMCTYSDQTSCTAYYEFCDIIPPNIPFADEFNCHKYYQCSKKNKLEAMVCPTGNYFDKTIGECIPKAQVDCYKHPIPDEVCNTVKLPYRNKFVGDQATCRGYFYCKDLGIGKVDTAPNWGQCSNSQFFNSNEEACQARSHVKCDEDRCDGRFDGQLEISGREGCQHYLICGNGYTKSEEYCGDGKYFNADTLQCTSQRILYPACA